MAYNTPPIKLVVLQVNYQVPQGTTHVLLKLCLMSWTQWLLNLVWEKMFAATSTITL